MRPVIYKVLRTVAIAALIVGSAGLIAVSPAGLNLFSSVKGVDWLKLSSIGQTYGAVSALISGIALAGVVISLILQSRELHLVREQAFRGQQFELLRFAIDNPSFVSSWGYVPPEGASVEDVRRVGYTNMIFSFWGSGYATRKLNDYELRQNFEGIFQGEAGRSYWEGSRNVWHKEATRRMRRFAWIAEEEYRKATAAGPPLIPASPPRDPKGRKAGAVQRFVAHGGTRLVTTFATGFLAAQALRARRNRTR